MGILGRLGGIAEMRNSLENIPEVQERAGVSISSPDFLQQLGLVSFDGPHITETSAMNFAAVYRAVSIIASNIAGLDSGAYKYDGDIKIKVPTFLDEPFKPRPDMDPFMSRFEWYELLVTWLLLHGNFYAEKLRNSYGQVVALNPIHPKQVQTVRDHSYAGGKKHTVNLYDGALSRTLVGGSERFVHIMGLSLDGVTGMSVVSAARLGIGIGLVGDKSAYSMFDRGATVSGLVTPREGEEMSDEDVKFVKRKITDSMTGAENTGDIAVINRRLEFLRFTMSAQDAQFLESRTFQIDEIGRWFGIPSHLLNLSQKSTSWGPGIAEQNIGLARYTLSPWTDRIASRLTMLVPRGQNYEFDYNRFLRPEPQSFIESILGQIAGGLITPNEGRRLLNMPPIEGGDELRGVTTNDPEPEPEPESDPDADSDIPGGDTDTDE